MADHRLVYGFSMITENKFTNKVSILLDCRKCWYTNITEALFRSSPEIIQYSIATLFFKLRHFAAFICRNILSHVQQTFMLVDAPKAYKKPKYSTRSHNTLDLLELSARLP